MGQMTPTPEEGQFSNRRDYLFALVRHPGVRPAAYICETPLDVSRQDPPVTLIYNYEPRRRAVRLLGVFRGEEELNPSRREAEYLKTYVRSIMQGAAV